MEKFTPRKLEVLDLIQEPHTSLSQLAMKGGMKQSNFSRHLHDLKEMGLVEVDHFSDHATAHIVDPEIKIKKELV